MFWIAFNFARKRLRPCTPEYRGLLVTELRLLAPTLNFLGPNFDGPLPSVKRVVFLLLTLSLVTAFIIIGVTKRTLAERATFTALQTFQFYCHLAWRTIEKKNKRERNAFKISATLLAPTCTLNSVSTELLMRTLRETAQKQKSDTQPLFSRNSETGLWR